jgi:phosphonate transport system substrate-binding protein
MRVLKLASCMAEYTGPFCRGVARYIGARLDRPVEYIDRFSWQEREQMFDAGEIQILWLCGLPYVFKVAALRPKLELLAMPVPAGSRYSGRPVYFSDFVVHQQSPFRQFSDLRGRSWAFNEPRSHSGYNVVRAHLSGLRAGQKFFARVVESGAHVKSLRMILAGHVDGAAVDSTVLEWAVQEEPELSEQLRVIGTLGPSPIPPWVVSTTVPSRLRRDLRTLLLDMHRDPSGVRVLADGRIDHFVAAQDRAYDPIRQMAREAQSINLGAA